MFKYVYTGLDYFYVYCNLVERKLNNDSCFALHYKTYRKGKSLRKHSLHGKTAASVFIKLFISGNNDATLLTVKVSNLKFVIFKLNYIKMEHGLNPISLLF